MPTAGNNVLYVTAERSRCNKEHDTIVVTTEGEKRTQVPIHHLESVVLFDGSYMTADLMGALAEAGVSVAYFSRTGRFLARVEGMPGGNVLLRRAQHRAADSTERSLALARSFVVGKLVNTRRFLRREAREVADP